MMYNASDFARKVLLEHWNDSLPVDPVIIANKLGIKVFGKTDINGSGYFEEETSSIYVNTNEPLVRQRFTVAHELGHAILGHGSSPRESYKLYNKSNYQIQEFQANEFAGELLMPYDALNYFFYNTNNNYENLCKIFNVSPQAMNIRLRRLGFLL